MLNFSQNGNVVVVVEAKNEVRFGGENGWTVMLTDEEAQKLVGIVKGMISERNGVASTPTESVDTPTKDTKVATPTKSKSAKQTKAPTSKAPTYKHSIYDAEWGDEWKNGWMESNDPEVHHIDTKGNKWMHPYNEKAYKDAKASTDNKKHGNVYIVAGFCKA